MSERMPIPRRAPILCWAARIAGIAAIAFISSFAFDVYEPGAPLKPMLVAVTIHLMPSVFLAGVLLVAWFWPRVGGLLFLAVALLPFLLLANGVWVNALHRRAICAHRRALPRLFRRRLAAASGLSRIWPIWAEGWRQACRSD